MKHFILAFMLALTAFSCGTDSSSCYTQGNNCHDGKDGKNGADGDVGPTGPVGQPGQNGIDVVFLTTSVTSCPAGGWTYFFAYDSNRNGKLDFSDDDGLQSMTICNGVKGDAGATGPKGDTGATGATGEKGDKGDTGDTGATGPAGSSGTPTGYTPVAVIDPCGPSGGYDEVLLVLANGQILASFSDDTAGDNTRFSLIKSGDYVTTDGSNCHFHVDNNNNVTW